MTGEGKTRSGRLGVRVLSVVMAAAVVAVPAAGAEEAHGEHGGHGEAVEGDGQWHPWEWVKTLGFYPFGPPGARTSRISEEHVPEVIPEKVPDRPRRLEVGDRFVGTGNIVKGWTIPGGAVLQPSVLISGLYRNAVQAFDTGAVVNAEWANRLDIFANFKITNTNTERIVVGMRPFDDNFIGPNPATGQFTGYYFRPDNRPGVETDSSNRFNSDITTLFFEMELAEVIPNLDLRDEHALDVHFVVGRQPLFFQEGILIFDTMDAFGVTKNQIGWPFGQNLQYSFLWAWDEINRGNNIEVDDTHLFLGSLIADFTMTTVNFDMGYVYDEGDNDFPPDDPDTDGFYGGLSFVQRVGKIQTALRAVFSHAVDDRIPKGMAPTSVVDDGVVIFAEASYTPAWTENYLYWTFFWAIDNYTPMARMPGTGGPMGRAGINFAGVGLGRYAAAVPNFAQDVVGGAIGYQWWLDHDFRKNLLAEIGWRKDTNDVTAGAAALALRYQQAFGQHVLLQIDLHGSVAESRDEGWGSRLQLSYAF